LDTIETLKTIDISKICGWSVFEQRDLHLEIREALEAGELRYGDPVVVTVTDELDRLAKSRRREMAIIAGHDDEYGFTDEAIYDDEPWNI
jgi:hypothetical protein